MVDLFLSVFLAAGRVEGDTQRGGERGQQAAQLGPCSNKRPCQQEENSILTMYCQVVQSSPQPKFGWSQSQKL